jgi:O-antigen ligase
MGLALVGLGTIGALATQTRAQLLAIAVAILFFGLLFLIRRPTKTAIATAVALCVLGAITVAIVPPLRNLAIVVVERQRELGDNARLEDEWLPALNLWERRGPLASVIGIGLGEPIRTFSGDEKTYIHNQAIYNVVYTGFLGLVMVYGVYFASLFVFLRRFWRDRTVYDLGAAACLLAIMVYALFFAVHKLLSFNLMLFTLVAMAMRQSSPPAVSDEERAA